MKRLTRKALGLVLSLLMLLTILPVNLYAQGATETPDQAVTSTLEYYKTVRNKNLTSYWDTLALYSAGEELGDGTWILPVVDMEDDPAVFQYAGAILNELAKGGYPESWINDLADRQNGDGSFSNGTNDQIFAMLALDAVNGTYDRLSALSWLIDQQFDNGGFSWGEGVEPDVDMTGMALIALGKYVTDDVAKEEKDLAQPSVEAAVDFLKAKQIPSGGFAGAWGNNANTDAAAVLGLVAAGEDVQSAEWTTGAEENPFTGLLKYRADDNGFGWEDNSVSNAMATAQVLLALDDIAADQSTFHKVFEQDGDTYIYFSGDTITVESGNPLRLRLMGINLDSSGISTPVEKAAFSVLSDYEPKVVPEEDGDGYVTITFNQAGTYILQAEAVLKKDLKTAVLTIPVTGSSSHPGDTPELERVTLTVRGMDEEIFFSDSVEYHDGDTALAVLLRQTELDTQTRGSLGNMYVESINGLAEFDYEPTSGWIYKVDGQVPSQAADAYKLSAGQTIEWIYSAEESATNTWLHQSGISVLTKDYSQAEIKQILAELMELISSQEIQDEMDIFLLAKNNAIDKSSALEMLIDRVRENEGNFSKATDLAKIVMAAQAIGLNPENIGGYNLLATLWNFDNITRQGVNAPTFALLAYDILGVEIPAYCINSREKLIADILSFQNNEGGFALARNGNSDPDLTAMAITALSKYQDQRTVQGAVDKGLDYLSRIQQPDGMIPAASVKSSETLSQVIVALTALNIGLDDERFVKAENNLLTALLSFKTSGGFKHIEEGSADQIATRQAALALTAYYAYLAGEPGLFESLAVPVAFWDLKDVEWAQEAIDHLASRNVLNGFEDGSFRPLEKVSREQLVTMLLMNFYPNFEAAPASFADVPEQAWFAPFVGAAEQMGITGGIGEGLFGAGTPISRQDMAVLADKIALKAGIVMNPRPDLARIVFADADAISAYAVGSVERLRAAGIVAGKPDGRFAPQDSCTRAEAAVIIYGLIKE